MILIAKGEMIIVFLFVIGVFTTNSSAAQTEVKICEQNSMQFFLNRLNDVPGKNRWLGKINALDKPLPDNFKLRIVLFTFGSDVNIVEWDKSWTQKGRGMISPYAGTELMLENLQDVAYLSGLNARFGHWFEGEVSRNANYYFAFVIEIKDQAAFPFVDEIKVSGREVCGSQVSEQNIRKNELIDCRALF